jgi:hypothetical protein
VPRENSLIVDCHLFEFKGKVATPTGGIVLPPVVTFELIY